MTNIQFWNSHGSKTNLLTSIHVHTYMAIYYGDFFTYRKVHDKKNAKLILLVMNVIINKFLYLIE